MNISHSLLYFMQASESGELLSRSGIGYVLCFIVAF